MALGPPEDLPVSAIAGPRHQVNQRPTRSRPGRDRCAVMSLTGRPSWGSLGSGSRWRGDSFRTGCAVVTLANRLEAYCTLAVTEPGPVTVNVQVCTLLPQ